MKQMKILAIAFLAIIIVIGGIYYKNNNIEKSVILELEKIVDKNFFTYKEVKCEGIIETNCKIQNVNFIFESEKGQSSFLVDYIKMYNVESYYNIKEINNKDIKYKIDFVGVNIEKKNFLKGITDNFLIDLMEDLYKSVNKFEIQSEFVINFKSRKDAVLNKFDLQKLEIKTKHLSVGGNLLATKFSIYDTKDTIIQNLSGYITNHNFDSLIIKWLHNMQNKYPDKYKEFCEVVDLNPKIAKPIRVFGKLRKVFAEEVTKDNIKNSQLKIQKDYFLALKNLIEGESKTMKISLENKTSISIANFITGVMTAMIAKQNVDEYILNNFKIKIESK